MAESDVLYQLSLILVKFFHELFTAISAFAIKVDNYWLTFIFFPLSPFRHHQHGRWQARIGRVAGNKDLYLGTFSKFLLPPPLLPLFSSFLFSFFFYVKYFLHCSWINYDSVKYNIMSFTRSCVWFSFGYIAFLFNYPMDPCKVMVFFSSSNKWNNFGWK